MYFMNSVRIPRASGVWRGVNRGPVIPVGHNGIDSGALTDIISVSEKSYL